MTPDEALAQLKARTVTDPCPARDKKDLPCGLPAHHPQDRHMRYAVEGELPYYPGPGNSIVSWPAG